jgi:hypothetical protein
VEIFKTSKHIILIFHQIKPSSTRKAINERHKISKAINRSCGTRSPHIRMYQIKNTGAPTTSTNIRTPGVLAKLTSITNQSLFISLFKHGWIQLTQKTKRGMTHTPMVEQQ